MIQLSVKQMMVQVLENLVICDTNVWNQFDRGSLDNPMVHLSSRVVVYMWALLSLYLGFFRVYLGFHLGFPYAAKIIEPYCTGIRANCSGVKIYYNP